MNSTQTPFWVLLFLATLLLEGCIGRNPPFQGTISGQVISHMDNATAVPYAKVIAYRINGLDPLPDPQYWIPVDSTIADQNGEFTLDYEVGIENPFMLAQGSKDEYFRNFSAAYFRRVSDSIQVYMLPKTYFKVHIEDEYPYRRPEHSSIYLYNTYLDRSDTIYQYPLDTTILMPGTPKLRSDSTLAVIRYRILYDQPNFSGTSGEIPHDGCAPFDTCEVWFTF